MYTLPILCAKGADRVVPPNQLGLLVILIIVAILLLNWEARSNLVRWDERREENASTETEASQSDHK
jgi:hypothetical protein